MRPQVTQPPAICRAPPLPGPRIYTWPPLRARIAATWDGPPTWPEPRHAEFNADAVFYPPFSSWAHTELFHNFLFTADCYLFGADLNNLAIQLLVNNVHPYYSEADSQIFTLPTTESILISDPPLTPADPGHTWHVWLAAFLDPLVA